MSPPKTMTRNKASTSDRISNLPTEIIENILLRLPLRDTVKTCVLSKNWNEKWKAVPQIVFDKSFCTQYPRSYNMRETLFNCPLNSIRFRNTPILASVTIKATEDFVPESGEFQPADMTEVFHGLPVIEDLFVGYNLLMLNYGAAADENAAVEFLETQDFLDISLKKLREVEMLTFDDSKPAVALTSLPGEGDLVPCDNNVIARLVGLFSGIRETHRTALSSVNLAMEEITKHWSMLSLSEKEGSGLHLRKEQAIAEYAIAARFLTKRPLNIEAIANTFTPLWRAKSGFKIKNLGNHLILFSFDNLGDVDRILKSEPWCFDKHLMVLSQFDKDTPLNPLELKKVSFWVQVFDIPVRFRNREVAEQICEAIGSIIHPTDASNINGGSFIRVRVRVDISLPLYRGRLITLEDGKEHWVSFKYERLPNLCYWCGLLTHGDRDCNKWIDSEGSLQKEDQQFGPWLRAPPFQASRKSVLSVPGFFAKKKKENPVHYSPEPPSQPPMAAPETTSMSTPPNMPTFNAKDLIRSNPEKAGNIQTISNSKEDPTMNLPPTKDFEQLIREIDQDISCFDHSEGPQVNISGPSIKSDTGPYTDTLNTQLNIPKPLQDSTNLDRSNQNQAQEGKKWTRIQRPSLPSDDQILGIPLGKHLHPSSHDESPPTKRKTPLGENQNAHPSELDEVLKTIQPSVTQEMNDQLLMLFTRIKTREGNHHYQTKKANLYKVRTTGVDIRSVPPILLTVPLPTKPSPPLPALPTHQAQASPSLSKSFHGSLSTEMLFCSTIVGLPLLIPPLLVMGELFKAWVSCWEHPYVYGVLGFEAMATFVGQVSVLSLIALFGAATTAMMYIK
ncbi:hypothetical protein SO802_006249 [Lithocarpus litseifolius]|uniref:F-box domain-containing protein n=1 Tax=Lithocarpus litseifolius TaxID=425828 RepID=A0AAW2DL50_9ROSI